MNFTIDTHSNTWKNPKTRTAIGIGGVALALSIAIGGISSLPSSSSREASVTPQNQSQPSTLFANMADAALANESVVAASPAFATMANAQDALGFGQPGERSVSLQAELANIAAGEAIVYGVFDSQPVVASFPGEDALGLGQPGERSLIAPQFTNMVDAWEASAR